MDLEFAKLTALLDDNLSLRYKMFLAKVLRILVLVFIILAYVDKKTS